jgi:hypothetical protein
MKTEDLTGRKFNKLTVLEFSHKIGRKAYWKCKCDCGNIAAIRSDSLKNGHSKSCGCYHDSCDYKVTHGLSHNKIYDTYVNMKGRCLNPDHQSYPDYGGRGITICEKWMTFEGFYEDMKIGYSDDLSLDRIDNSKGYYKENCRWATKEQQQNNTRWNRYLTYNGTTQSVSQWAHQLGVGVSTLATRLRRGWTIERALTTPVL